MRKVQVSMLAVMLATGGVLYPAAAQPPDAVPATEPAKSWHALRVRNVRPGILAYWLDPKHNPEPVEMVASRQTMMRELKTPTGKLTNGVFDLPKGVEIVIGVDSRNELIVFGTDWGVLEIKGICSILDKPLRQVEISAYDVEMDAVAFKSLGLDQPKDPSLYFLRQDAAQNFPAKLEALATAGKVEILNAPRVTAINNLAASIGTTTATPVSLKFQQEAGAPTLLFMPLQTDAKSSQFFVAERSGITVTPTINNDDTVTMLLTFGTTFSLRGAPDTETSIPLSSGNSIQSVVNVENGQTVAIGGLKTRSQEKEGAEAQERIRVYFVTANIIQRADEN